MIVHSGNRIMVQKFFCLCVIFIFYNLPLVILKDIMMFYRFRFCVEHAFGKFKKLYHEKTAMEK